MPADSHDRSIQPGTFPSSDHFPLGRAYGHVESTPEPPSAARPFGLTHTVAPVTMAVVDPAALSYDDETQVGLIRQGARMVPLSRHTTGQTNTVTQGGDGHGTNQDSDTDHRED